MVPVSNGDDDDPEVQAMHQYTLRRRRRFWIWMSFGAGLPLVVVSFIAGTSLTSSVRPGSIPGQFVTMAIGFSPLLAWSSFCAFNILKTFLRLSAETRFCLTIPLALLLGAMNTALVYWLFWAGCYLIMGGKMRF